MRIPRCEMSFLLGIQLHCNGHEKTQGREDTFFNDISFFSFSRLL
jgi:hypothetical protein